MWGKLPKIETYFESETKVEMIITTSKSNKGRSRGVLVNKTLPCRTQLKTQRASKSSVPAIKRTNFALSKYSVVKEVKISGVSPMIASIKKVFK